MKKITFFILLFANLLFSQNVVLDPSFGVGGVALNNITEIDNSIQDIGFQSDGKIICLLHFFENVQYLKLSRYSKNGILDKSFGDNGFVITNVKNNLQKKIIFKIQSDNKIIVSGLISDLDYQMGVVRYNADGSIDNFFGINGVSPISNFTNVSIDIQNDSKILVCGTYGGGQGGAEFGVTRLNSDGTVDQNFGNFGFISYNIDVSQLYETVFVYNVKYLQNDTIILSGNVIDETSGIAEYGLVLLNLNYDGTLNQNFGLGGKIIDMSGSGFDCLATDFDSNIFVGGQLFYGLEANINSMSFGMTKYNNSGVLDDAFGNEGKVITSVMGKSFFINNISIDSDGSIICGGLEYNYGEMTLIKYTTLGILDNNFDSNGIMTIQIGSYDSLEVLKLKSNNKILCGGSVNLGASNETVSALVQFNVSNLSTSNLSTTQFSVAPNPFLDYINLSFASKESQVLDINLYDINGRKIQNIITQKKFPLGNNLQKIDLPETLTKGIYFLNIYDGQQSKSIKIVK